jgi:hypothetical protein
MTEAVWVAKRTVRREAQLRVAGAGFGCAFLGSGSDVSDFHS